MRSRLLTNRFASVLLFLIFVCQSFGQNVVFNKLSSPDNGNFNFVSGIAQDVDGVMWFATKKGLYRYNGIQLTSYQNNPFNPNSVVSDFLEYVYADPNGNIWIGSLGYGLDLFNPKTGNFTHYQHNPDDPSSLSNDTVTAILRDSQGDLWIGTHGGLDKFNATTNNFSHYRNIPENPSSLSFNQVRELFEDKNGRLWIGTGSPYPDNGGGPNDGGLNLMNTNKDGFTHYLHNPDDNQSLSNNKISAIFEDDKGMLWIGTAMNGLHKMNRENGTFERMVFNPADPDAFSAPPVDENTEDYENITFISQDIAGNYWYGTATEGLFQYDARNKKLVNYNEMDNSNSGFINEGAWTAYNSRDGMLWIGGTTQGNIYNINPLRIEIPHTKTTSPVNDIYEDSKGLLWIATDDSLVVKNKKGKIEKQNIVDINPSNGNDNWVQLIEKDRLGNLWIGGGNGLNLWDEKKEIFIQFKNDPKDLTSISDSRVISVFEDSKNNFWVGTVNGLNLMNRQTGTFTHYYLRRDDTVRVGNNVVLSIIEDKNKQLWVGLANGGGIFLFDPATQQSKNYLKGNVIGNLFLDHSGILWVGSELGLYKYIPDEDKFLRYSDPGLISGSLNIMGIVEDDKQFLWISSVIGLVRINPDRNQSSIFGNYYGIPENNLYWKSTFKDAAGNLYFGGSTGYYMVKPEELSSNLKPPEIVISGFSLADQYIIQGKDGPLKQSLSKINEIKLSYSQNIFSFDFDIIDYVNPEQNRMTYFLENYDKNWNQVGSDRKAYYFNIPPGKYTFFVKGANSYGAWAEKKIDILINPPWYRTWIAYAIYAVMFILAIFGFDRIMRRRIVEMERKKTQERELAQAKEIEKAYTELKATQTQLIQSEKMASLGELTAGIAHEIQNPLNFVNNFSEVNTELIEEAGDEIDNGNIEEVKLILIDIKENEQKISHHGKRAESIVKGMLLHSRGSSGEKEPTDINALADEFLRLSYHGLRAKDKSFNADFNLESDDSLPKLNAVQQDIGRVFLNLINNAFYAVYEKSKENNSSYKPQVNVVTKKLKNKVEITIQDNGNGIPEKIKDKIFQPFFTTKPAGQGTGLGLSMSYDIITKQHNGELNVNSVEGEGTKFKIIIPIE